MFASLERKKRPFEKLAPALFLLFFLLLLRSLPPDMRLLGERFKPRYKNASPKGHLLISRPVSGNDLHGTDLTYAKYLCKVYTRKYLSDMGWR